MLAVSVWPGCRLSAGRTINQLFPSVVDAEAVKLDRACAVCEHDLFLRHGRVVLAGGGDLTHRERAGALQNHRRLRDHG